MKQVLEKYIDSLSGSCNNLFVNYGVRVAIMGLRTCFFIGVNYV